MHTAGGTGARFDLQHVCAQGRYRLPDGLGGALTDFHHHDYGRDADYDSQARER
jgi:hypothetical protein